MPELPTDLFAQAKARFLAGLAHQQAGRWQAAEQHYLASLALLPGRPSTLINLAATRLSLGQAEAALGAADQALAAEPDSADAWLHRGTALARLARLTEALAAFDRLLALAPAHAVAWSSRGSLLRELQRLDEAADAFRQALQHGGDAALNRYYLAAVESDAGPDAAPSAYVQQLFDGYAQGFDQHLVQGLQYQAHQRLVGALPDRAGGLFASALDLGCGTGLCGPLLRPRVQRLHGVDLSAGMLARAAELGVYDQLDQADAVQFLQHTELRFDLLLAADMLIYLGDLAPLFAGAARVMVQGLFCFSVELLDDAHGDQRLLPSLRYAHSQAYLLRLAQRHGFEPLSLSPGALRQEQGQTVAGLYVTLRRRPS